MFPTLPPLPRASTFDDDDQDQDDDDPSQPKEDLKDLLDKATATSRNIIMEISKEVTDALAVERKKTIAKMKTPDSETTDGAHEHHNIHFDETSEVPHHATHTTNKEKRQKWVSQHATQLKAAYAAMHSGYRSEGEEQNNQETPDSLAEKQMHHAHDVHDVPVAPPPGGHRLSNTIRRYSQVPQQHRMSQKIVDSLKLLQTRRLGPVEAEKQQKKQSLPKHFDNVNLESADLRFHKPTKKSVRYSMRETSWHSRHSEAVKRQPLAGNQLVHYLANNTHFTDNEVKALQHMHHAICEYHHVKGLNRFLFREVLETHFGVTSELMLDNLFFYFGPDQDNMISSTQWVWNLSTYLRGSFEEHMKLCYDIYDIDGDGAITKIEVQNHLHGCLQNVPGIEDDMTEVSNVRDILELLMKKLDPHKQGFFTLEDFRHAVRRDPLFLQCLGAFLPSCADVQAFMALITEDYNNYKLNYSLPLMPSYPFERNKFTGDTPTDVYWSLPLPPKPGHIIRYKQSIKGGSFKRSITPALARGPVPHRGHFSNRPRRNSLW